MFPYADYEYYVNKVHGDLSDERFEREITDASYFLRYITLGKSDTCDSEDLKYATCAIAEMYAKEKEKYESGKANIKSENTDGYSATYTAEIKDGETLEEMLKRKATDIARKYLATTGLLNRKAGRISW